MVRQGRHSIERLVAFSAGKLATGKFFRQGCEMLRTKTVLILGAGSSCELGFPDGNTLLGKIAESLGMKFERNGQIAGSPSLLEAFKRHHAAHAPQSEINGYLSAGWRLHDAAIIARSIDNAIDQNDGDDLVATVGKMAIAHQIGLDEDTSRLRRTSHEPHIFEWDPLRETWLFPFAQMLTTDVRRSEVERIFDNLSVISFNYDRSFEAFLPTILHHAYGIHAVEAQALCARLEVLHPYGSLGPLPWQSQTPEAVEFGAASTQPIEKISATLRTFTEQVASDGIVGRLQQMIAEAGSLIFLGFGFHRQNMTLLTPMVDSDIRRVFGTVYKEPPAAVSMTVGLLNVLCGSGPSGNRGPVPELLNSTCFEYMKQHFSPITG